MSQVAIEAKFGAQEGSTDLSDKLSRPHRLSS
jgi:hypothetical protein